VESKGGKKRKEGCDSGRSMLACRLSGWATYASAIVERGFVPGLRPAVGQASMLSTSTGGQPAKNKRPRRKRSDGGDDERKENGLSDLRPGVSTTGSPSQKIFALHKALRYSSQFRLVPMILGNGVLSTSSRWPNHCSQVFRKLPALRSVGLRCLPDYTLAGPWGSGT